LLHVLPYGGEFEKMNLRERADHGQQRYNGEH
jgi:hypothetical protein